MSVLLVVNTAPYGARARTTPSGSPMRWPCATSTSRSSSWATRWSGERRPGPARRARLARAPARELLEKGVDVSCCGTCCATRGLAEDAVALARVATIHDLAEAPSATTASSPSEAAVARCPPVSRLQRRVADVVRSGALLRRERPLMLSGGADSMALLSLVRAVTAGWAWA